MPFRSRYKPISDYGVIGNLRTTAHVGMDGSIDWCCFPQLASASVFGALLDIDRGGHFRVAPPRYERSAQRYIEDTNVLETHFQTESGALRITDFMPLSGSPEDLGTTRTTPEIRRLLRCDGGAVEVEVDWSPKLNYASQSTTCGPSLEGFVAFCGNHRLYLRGLPPDAKLIEAEGERVRARFIMKQGQEVALITRWGEAIDDRAIAETASCLRETVAYWHAWMHKPEATGDRGWAGEWAGLVRRSELTLKLLTHAETGAIAAAATTSLPEEIGGVRNWDYRYSWIRDASLTAQALAALGHEAQAKGFLWWAERAASSERDRRHLRIMYGLHGETSLKEFELSHLEGYRKSKPVRIGNEAAEQHQLDIYGELLTTAYELVRSGESLPEDICSVLTGAANSACEQWRDPDAGIWEVRGPWRHYLHSKVLAWAGLHRGVHLADAGILEGDPLWRRERDLVCREILEKGFNKDVGAFTQYFGSTEIDASALVIPLHELLPAEDPRVQSTVNAIQRELLNNGLVYRYLADDGLPGSEGAFGLTTFWLVDVLALSGRTDEAREIFDGVARRANHLGLFPEQFDPSTGEFLGNFPQAFTHIGLINSSLYLAYAEGRSLPVPALMGTPEHRNEEWPLHNSTARTQDNHAP